MPAYGKQLNSVDHHECSCGLRSTLVGRKTVLICRCCVDGEGFFSFTGRLARYWGAYFFDYIVLEAGWLVSWISPAGALGAYRQTVSTEPMAELSGFAAWCGQSYVDESPRWARRDSDDIFCRLFSWSGLGSSPVADPAGALGARVRVQLDAPRWATFSSPRAMLPGIVASSVLYEGEIDQTA